MNKSYTVCVIKNRKEQMIWKINQILQKKDLTNVMT